MTQLPPPGVKVRRGWSIRVAQSLGPQRVAIPDVTGETERVAELNVRRRGLEMGSTAQLTLPGVPAGQVVAQSPPAKASGISVPKIHLLVSRGSDPAAYVMPNFAGQPVGTVTLTLQEAGIKVGKVLPAAPAEGQAPQEQPQTGAASMVVSQSVAPGTRVAAGDTVDFEVR